MVWIPARKLLPSHKQKFIYEKFIKIQKKMIIEDYTNSTRTQYSKYEVSTIKCTVPLCFLKF